MNELSKYTNDQLVREIIAGEALAFKEVYRRFAQQMKAQALYFYQDEFLAEDGVQVVMTWLWTNRHKLREDIRLESYLMRAVINHCLYSKSKQKTLDARKKVYAYIMETRVENRPFEREELAKVLQAAMEEIQPANQAAFRMAYLEDRKSADIAEELGLTSQDVRNRISRALKTMRSALSHLKVF